MLAAVALSLAESFGQQSNHNSNTAEQKKKPEGKTSKTHTHTVFVPIKNVKL